MIIYWSKDILRYKKLKSESSKRTRSKFIAKQRVCLLVGAEETTIPQNTY